MITALFISFFILLIIGCPIALALGVSGIVSLSSGGFDLMIIVQRIFSGVNSFPLMAIPFFMLAGSLMGYGGISKRIVKFADAIVGHVTGGLSMAAIIACAIFAAISGSAVATVAAIGGIIVPEMVARGYKPGNATAVVTASGTMGPVIPPSIGYVIYASIVGVSVQKMFLAGYLPGILEVILLMLVAYFKAKKETGIAKQERKSFAEIIKVTRECVWALLSPVIIIFCMFTGICTPTEAGAISCLYSLIVGMFIYKEINGQKLFAALKEASLSTVIVMFLIGTATLFSWNLSVAQVPQTIKTFFLSITSDPKVLWLLFNVLFLIVGCFLDSAPAMMLFVPVMAPIAQSVGIDMIHFGIVISLNLCIGLLTPPVGTCLFVGCRLTNMRVLDLFKEVFPYFLALIVVLLILTYCPGIVMFLPNLLM